tara:strand:+ start:49 stop:828 length:780 start_codon:yes stop_codon:yes gene_type:complete
MNVIAGSNAHRVSTIEEGGDFMFSEEAVKEMGLETPEEILGRGVEFFNVNGRATGVVNDIHVYSFRQNIYASAYIITSNQFHKYLSIRVNTANVSETISYTQGVWEQMFPDYPFDYIFLDDSFEQMHRADMQLAETVTWFALLAIFVACLGLFGLSAYAAEQRVKEIGIRKVLGATVSSIVALFSKDFIKLVVLGAAIAVPVAWYFSNNWLQEFAYRTEIGTGPFLLAGSVLIFIALTTIGYNAIKAGLRNPVDSLRSE